MAFDYSLAELQPGHTVPLVLDMLSGSPEIDVEHLGKTNKTYLADEIASANSKPAGSSGKRKLMSKAQLAEDVRRMRARLKHAVRHLRAKHSDGSAATDADIPEWIESIPDDVVETIFMFAVNAENFRRYPVEGDAKELAEK